MSIEGLLDLLIIEVAHLELKGILMLARRQCKSGLSSDDGILPFLYNIRWWEHDFDLVQYLHGPSQSAIVNSTCVMVRLTLWNSSCGLGLSPFGFAGDMSLVLLSPSSLTTIEDTLAEVGVLIRTLPLIISRLV